MVSFSFGSFFFFRDAAVMVTIDLLTVALLICAVLYSFCLVLASRKLRVLNRVRPELSTKKILIVCVALVSVVRIATMLGVAAMNIANVRADNSLTPPEYAADNKKLFYDKSMVVLFDLPNCLIVSVYVLLALVYAECFVEARLHTESNDTLKKGWVKNLIIFLALIYVMQLTLYGCICLMPDKVRNFIIYVGIAGINFAAVLMVLIFWIYLNLRFSGFPYRSETMRASLSRVSCLITFWSLTRIIWGAASLLIFVFKVELLKSANTPAWYFGVLLGLFFVCEVLPIIVLLDYSYMQVIGLERGEIRPVVQEDIWSLGTHSTFDRTLQDGNTSSILREDEGLYPLSEGSSVLSRDESTDPLLPQTVQDESNSQ